MDEQDIIELKNLVKRLTEVNNLIEKEEQAQRKRELYRSFASLAEQFKKKVFELS
ncbi:MAG: hypothetical protein KJ767_00605 [Nanoarchaeota archaeon]|nr:hypothetical protein [Nanoarchaeota archaeon]